MINKSKLYNTNYAIYSIHKFDIYWFTAEQFNSWSLCWNKSCTFKSKRYANEFIMIMRNQKNDKLTWRKALISNV